MAKRLSTAIVVLALLLPALARAEVSADGLWTDVDGKSVTPTGARAIQPKKYRLLSLDRPALKRLLKTAPREDTGAPGILVTLPLPDGGFARFSVVESPIMEPELAAKFPELKTYLGEGIEDPTATVRISVTPAGVQAQILSASGTLYVDPYQSGDRRHHISYDRQNYRRSAKTPPLKCLVERDPDAPAPLRRSGAAQKISSGTQRRTYRAAIAATAEYTAFHGGTVAGGMAGIVAALNRVNGIYERDVAIRMVLVGNNNLIVFTDPATDPYTDEDADALINQNQTNIDAVIGSANYDIGHVFGTGGGGSSGLAGLGVPCNATRKARGVTGRGEPTGDPFWIDFVAHEMGHQFAGNHTFNSGNAGSCDAGNREPDAAFEPGSGSTIMAYAGICPPDDLQANSDAHFHGFSIQEIVTFSTGAGDVCAVKTNTGNTPPTVDAGPNGAPAFTIPINTPFELTGTASDVNGDALTYNWEELDLGPAGPPGAPTGNAPIFRSFRPFTVPLRRFPLGFNTANPGVGDLLPSYSRDLNFQLTVRDNRAGGGGINQDTIALKVSANAGPFRMTSPNTAVTWRGGSTQTVTWNVANTTAAPVSCPNVNILLSTDQGSTYTPVFMGTPNDGSQQILVPNVGTSFARVKVACANNVFVDISDQNFTIDAVPVVAQSLRINDVSAAEGNTGTTAFTFTVSLSAASASTVTVNYAAAGGTATAPGDYAVATGTLTFSPGQTSKTLSVNVVGDAAVEPNETFVVNLSGATGATILDGQGSGTILNDDGGVLRINDRSLAEGNAGTTAFTFTVSLQTASAGTVTVNYAAANGTATAPGDYAATDGTLTFSPGQTSKTVTVNVVGNTTAEPNETFVVNLSGATGASIFDGQGVATILNDDGPTVRINDVSRAEGNAGASSLLFTVSLSPASASTVTVKYSAANGTAATPADYTSQSATVTFNPGETSKSVGVPVVGDTAVEPNETFVVNLTTATGATIFDNQGTGTILNDDGPVLRINDVSRAEGNSATTAFGFTVTLSTASAGTVTVSYAAASGTAGSPGDFAAANGTLTFSAGETSKAVTVNVVGDTVVEPNETFVVNLSGAAGASIFDGQGLGTISNDDGATLRINDASRTEGNAGSGLATLLVSLSPASTGTVSVTYGTASNTATAPSDYTPAGGTLTFAPGQTGKTVTVSFNGDTTVEPNETFFVNLSGATGATIVDGQGVVTIQNDDTATATEPAALAGITAQHNATRAGAMPVPSPALPPMSWSNTVASSAQAWANGCNGLDHDPGLGALGQGQNIFVSASSTGFDATAGQKAEPSWASEVADYDYATNTCAPGRDCGHYTQVVWRNSTSLGCGIKNCTVNSPFGATFPNWTLVVCNYAPPGNFNGQPPY